MVRYLPAIVKSCLLLITVVSLFGCGSKEPTYSFYFLDLTGEKERDRATIKCEWGETSIVGFKGADMGLFNAPWPDQAKLIWMDKYQNPLGKEVVIDLPKIDPERWQQVEYIMIKFLPDDKIVIKEFTYDEWYDNRFRTKFRAQEQPAYSVGVQNNTGTDISKLSVRFGEYYIRSEKNALKPAATKMNMNGWGIGHGYPHPITDTAVVRWTTPDGKAHEQEVEMKGKLPDDLDYQTLCFSIESDNTVKFQVRPTDDRKTWMYEGSPWTNPF